MRIAVGDVWSVRTTGWAARLIRFGAALGGQPNLDNHVVVVHHQDANGRWWGLEGRPGGVGQVDLARYLHNPYTVTNAGQPKTDAQRYGIAVGAEALLGTPYDWVGIAADGMDAIGAGHLWAQNWNGLGPPAHVVCSSYAAWLNELHGLERPVRRSARGTTPADWTAFDLEHGYNV